MLFANLVASRIENDKIRWDTLSKVAIGLTKPLKPEPKEKDSSRLRRNAADESVRVHDDADEGKGEMENRSETD